LSDNKIKESNNNESVDDYQAKEETTWTESDMTDSDKQARKKNKNTN
jgi:hypothetical protein